MKPAVEKAIEELKAQFNPNETAVRPDAEGGAYVTMKAVKLCTKLTPQVGWIGFHLSAQYPYADIYPVFMDATIDRIDGKHFEAPITRGHFFEGNPAIQISRRNSSAQSAPQKATTKILKIIDYLEKSL